MMILFLVLGIAAVIFFMKSTGFNLDRSVNKFTRQNDSSASEILKTRLARGEISREEYEEMDRIIREKEDMYEL